MMNILPYVRFLMTAVLTGVYINNVTFRSGDGVNENSFVIFNIITGSLLLIFLSYLIYQGILELKNRTWNVRLMRYYAIICEFLVLVDSLLVFLYYEQNFLEVAAALIVIACAIYLVLHEIGIIKEQRSTQRVSQ